MVSSQLRLTTNMAIYAKAINGGLHVTSPNLPFPCPDELKVALEEEASKRKISRAALIRLSIAKEIGFDLKKANTRAPRRRKYDSDEARVEAQRSRQRIRRELEQKLIRAVQSGEHEESIAALAKSLLSQRKNQ